MHKASLRLFIVLTYILLKFVYFNQHVTHAGNDYAHEGADDIEPSSSCCSPSEVGEYSLELIDNYPLDDEIGRRLSQMIPIPVCLAPLFSY